MKPLRTVLLAAGALVLFGGCQGDFDEKSVTEKMSPGVQYEIFPGDSIDPDGTTQINVQHTLSDDVKLVTIKNGSATLLRGDYKLNQ